VTDPTWTEPCDTGQPEPAVAVSQARRSRCGFLDLLKQIPDSDLGRIVDIDVTLEGVL
jgi:hypothetical protein